MSKQTQTSSSHRIAWIDVARGLGIVLVVYGHVLRGLLGSHFAITSKAVLASDYTIYTFHMPLFFVLAGLNVDHSLRKGRSSFLLNKLWTILYPYVLWSLVQGSVQLTMPNELNAPRSAWSLAAIFLWPIGQFWFLYVLFCCHLIALSCHAKRSVLLPLAFISLAIFPFMPASVLVPLTHSFPFYVAGIVLSNALVRWRPAAREAMVGTACCSALLWACSSLGRTYSGGNPLALVSCFATVSGICLMIALSHLVVQVSGVASRVTEVLGRTSLTIYILHVFAASGLRILLRRFHVLQWIPELVLGTLAGILLPLGAHLLLEKSKLLPALGLAPRLRRSTSPVPASGS